MSTEPITGLTYQAAGSQQTDALQNAELNYYGAWLNCVVLSVGDTTPPGSPANGDRYIVGTTATGAWATHDDALAVYRDGWQFYAPLEGVTVHNLDDASDWINEGSGGWAVKIGGSGIPDAPSDSTTYGRKDAAWVPVAGGGGALELLDEVILGTAATDIDFTGLDLDADFNYIVKAFAVPAVSGGHVISMFLSGDTTVTNYNSQLLYGLGASAGAQGGNNALIHFNNAMPDTSNPFSFVIDLLKVAGSKPNAMCTGVGVHTDGAPFWGGVMHRRNNTANVTDIKLRNSITNGFGVGTRIRLYRMN